MTRLLVCDASVIVAVLLDSGPDGRWATRQVADASLVAPQLMPFESANIVRRLELSGAVSADQAAQAHADLVVLAVELWPYELLAARTWQLRANLSCYDAAYVALAESVDAPLVTLDRRIHRAPGVRCTVEVPPPVTGRP